MTNAHGALVVVGGMMYARQVSTTHVPGPTWSTSSAAKPIGECVRCGGMRYEGLFHQCGTAIRFTQNLAGSDQPKGSPG